MGPLADRQRRSPNNQAEPAFELATFCLESWCSTKKKKKTVVEVYLKVSMTFSFTVIRNRFDSGAGCFM